MRDLAFVTSSVHLLDASWTSSDEDVITVSGDDPPVLTGVGVGTATITAIRSGLSATATIDVIAGVELPEGAVRWNIRPTVGSEMGSPIYTNRVDETSPEMFIVSVQPTALIVCQTYVVPRRLPVVSQNVDGSFRIHSWDRCKRSTMRDLSRTGGNQFSVVTAVEESAHDSCAGEAIGATGEGVMAPKVKSPPSRSALRWASFVDAVSRVDAKPGENSRLAIRSSP